MLARWWSGEPLDGWLVSEKLDGFRCLWDGARFLSREGTVWQLPARLYVGMPACPLDGELMHRGGIGRLRDLLNFNRPGSWASVTFHVFDAPLTGRVKQRLATLAKLDLPAWCSVVRHWRIDSDAHLRALMATLDGMSAEGFVARRPGSRYESGRSWNLLKYRFAGQD
jgi:DNA ligase-1